MTKELNNPLPVTASSKLFGRDGDNFGEFPSAFLGIHNFLHVQDQKPAGTHGGDFASGAWRTRILNTVILNNITGASLSSNQVTLPSGKYYLDASAPAYYQVGVHSIQLYNISDSVQILQGRTSQVGSAGTTASINNIVPVSGYFEILTPKVVELQHKCVTTCATYGFGVNSDVGQAYGIFADFKIWKLS